LSFFGIPFALTNRSWSYHFYAGLLTTLYGLNRITWSVIVIFGSITPENNSTGWSYSQFWHQLKNMKLWRRKQTTVSQVNVDNWKIAVYSMGTFCICTSKIRTLLPSTLNRLFLQQIMWNRDPGTVLVASLVE
jgi:hypothetical protein